MADDKTILIIDDGRAPDLHAIMDAMRLTERRVFDTIALPSDMLIENLRIPTAERIMGDIRGAERSLFGMGVMFSKLLNEMPVRVHRKRRWMPEAYHRRIQKKWNKRFGVGPVAVMMKTADILNMTQSQKERA